MPEHRSKHRLNSQLLLRKFPIQPLDRSKISDSENLPEIFHP